jgi:hypothetical protein
MKASNDQVALIAGKPHDIDDGFILNQVSEDVEIVESGFAYDARGMEWILEIYLHWE